MFRSPPMKHLKCQTLFTPTIFGIKLLKWKICVALRRKAEVTTTLFEYITNDAFDYINRHPTLKKAIIEKVYILKRDNPTFETLIRTIDKLLTKLNLPLTKAEPAVTETEPAVTETEPAVTTTRNVSYSYHPNYELFIKIATDMELTDIVRDAYTHYCQWIHYSKKWSGLDNKSVEDSISHYFKLAGYLNDHQERIHLMMSLLKKIT